MAKLRRLARYARRFLLEPRYRNRVIDVLNEHPGREPAAEAPSGPLADLDLGWLNGRRMYLVGGCELSYLRESLASRGLDCVLSFDLQIAQDPFAELSNPASPLHVERFDYVVFSQYQLLMAAVTLAQRGRARDAPELERLLAELERQLRAALQMLRRRSEAPVYVVGYPLRYRPWRGRLESAREGVISLREMLLRYELGCRAALAEHPRAAMVEPSLAFQDHPLPELLGSYDADGINDHLTRGGARLLADHLLAMIAVESTRVERVKAVVLDLDDTLWAGTLIEDGPGGVAVNAFRCRCAQAWAQRGIVLAVVSKNDPSALAEIQGLLPAELVAAVALWKISWEPKPTAFQTLARELNIGYGTIAFFDDNPLEREAVATLCPGVRVYDPSAFAENLTSLLFEPPPGGLGPERADHYRAQTRREEDAGSSGLSYEDFLRSCDVAMIARPARPGDLPRLAEICARTNQLNATRLRLDEGALAGRLASPESFLVAVELRDKYGDFGLVGVVVVAKAAAWRVEEMAFSCRSMGRGIETQTLALIAGRAAAEGVAELTIIYRPSDRNQSLQAIFRACGMIPDDGADGPGDEVPYRLDLSGGAPVHDTPWLQVENRIATVPADAG